MSLEHAILVSLAERSASGYDLTRRFDRSLGFFWKATHQQIYRTLARMDGDGLVASTVSSVPGRPDRKVYDLTDAGRQELAAWTRTPTPPERPRSAFAVKVRGMPHGDRDAVIEDIRRQRAHHAEQLAHYEASAARDYPDPSAVAADELPVYLVLRGGIRTERTYVDWCDEMLDHLAPPARPTVPPTASPDQEKS
ncbi:PadR family transcriptional regulator [Luteipulveratus flavus]|uniref:PadR family transcriptional regulator n=1 Tax=Luteipulveratus flavus TaxID=3031728 RepID=A0ABT6C1U6_9MICO|nr:PadR family transcriptional regulator [Luteipulveratus sp. YIM 133296]MDF8262730.1 PadR family transcriptional regulator [Luteipulveratus sp. YIM 133296]